MATSESEPMVNGAVENGTVDSDPEIEAEIEVALKEGTVDGKQLSEAQIRQIKLRHQQHRRTKSEDGDPNPSTTSGLIQVPRPIKNQRRSRCKGRGAAKKEGAGGKYTWGKVGKVYEEEPTTDPHDPNYDSDAQGNVTFEEMESELTPDQVPQSVSPIIAEFLASSDLTEAIDSLVELEASADAKPAIVRLIVTMALDKKAYAKELCSQLIAQMVLDKVVNCKEVESGIVLVLNEDLPDQVLDNPSAAETVGNLIARAMADMAVGHDFLTRWLPMKETLTNDHARASLDRAEIMWPQKHHLHDIWGTGGGLKPVRVLSKQMQLLLKEYLNCADKEEASRCLRELEVPHFHHELVYQAGVMSIESMHARVSTQLSSLLRSLHGSGQLSDDAILLGFERLYASLPDLMLDVPPAYTLAERWAITAKGDGYLPEEVARKVPQRGRKRFVSEGDGGRLKVVDVPHPLI